MRKRGILKRVVSLVLAAAALFTSLMMSGCGKAPLVDERCWWCSSSPSRGYGRSDGTACYVCDKCSGRCSFCMGTAEMHYESMVAVVFICKDCYNKYIRD